MRKMLILEKCIPCPYHWPNNPAWCDKAKRHIFDEKIPDWCPLPNALEGAHCEDKH